MSLGRGCRARRACTSRGDLGGPALTLLCQMYMCILAGTRASDLHLWPAVVEGRERLAVRPTVRTVHERACTQVRAGLDDVVALHEALVGKALLPRVETDRLWGASKQTGYAAEHSRRHARWLLASLPFVRDAACPISTG